MAADPGTFTREQEISNPKWPKPHFVLLGAGASKAALPNGDKNGMDLPLMREIAIELDLFSVFPDELRQLAQEDFEAAYSQFVDLDSDAAAPIETAIADYFGRLRLPDEPNLYDALLLSLRSKDAIFTFNWDPLLLHARSRLNAFGLNEHLPGIFYLHGNVQGAYCEEDDVFGCLNGRCSKCGKPFAPTRLLFPVEHKDYNTDPGIRRAWDYAEMFLKDAFMPTMFGYSAPVTDVEAFDLLQKAWGGASERNMEEFEIIHRPGADTEELLARWDPFIHSHHYTLSDSFWKSWLGTHPRRTAEAYYSQFWEAKFIEDNPIPSDFTDLADLVAWFRPLIDAEEKADVR